MSFPEYISVSGLPFMLQGWNAKYKKTIGIRDGCPVYRLEPYRYLLVLDIIGINLYRANGKWILESDYNYIPSVKYGLTPQSDPFGFWSNNVMVKPCD